MNDPVIDETHYTKPVDSDLNVGGFLKQKEFNVNDLKRDLAKYGLEVVMGKRAVNVSVIKNRK